MLFDSLWMGVPTITMAGRPPVGRIGASLMTNLELNEWIAADERSYIAKAISLSQDFNVLAALRSGMRARMSKSPVMDESGFARDVEKAYRKIWRNWCEK